MTDEQQSKEKVFNLHGIELEGQVFYCPFSITEAQEKVIKELIEKENWEAIRNIISYFVRRQAICN